MSKYLLSFTAISLQPYQHELVAREFLDTKDWFKVEKEVIENDILQRATLSTRKREYSEIKKRLQKLSSSQLEYYNDASSADVKYLTLLSCFKLYRFIYDFCVDVMREKLLLFDYQILNSDYENFYESKAGHYENLNTISDSSRSKIKQVLFKILESAQLIDSIKNRYIQKPYLSETLIKLIIKDDPKLLAAFLYSNSEIDTMVKRYR